MDSREGRPRLKTTRINHIVLPCADVEKQIHFYGDILGMQTTTIAEWRTGKSRLATVRVNEETMIDLMLSTPDAQGKRTPLSEESPRNLDHFCLDIEPIDLEMFADYLRGRGVTVIGEKPVTRLAGGKMGTSIYVNDFAGNTIEIRYPV